MRIAELAELAGVTVRTIRYYHQVGALPEPPRRSNGYRDYSADELVTLLRIAQLTGSGLSLAQAGALVAGSPDSVDDVLDDVDRTLEAEIAALTEQRERLAQARIGGHVGLSRVAAALSLGSADTPTAILFAHLYRDHPRIDVMADALMEPDLRASLTSVQERFEAIDETSSDRELESLASAMRAHAAEFAAELPPLSSEQARLVITVIERDLNDRQREFLHGQL